MDFGELPTEEAAGAILAHSVHTEGRTWKKGIVLGAGDIVALKKAGLDRLTVARLGPDDVDENTAAAELAAALVPDPEKAALGVGKAATGRVNLKAVGPGIVEMDRDAIDRLNQIDPVLTLATLAPWTRVSARTLVGTVKIIAYGLPRAALEEAKAIARAAIRVRPVERKSAGLILTTVPGQKPSLNDKGQAAVAERLRLLGIDLAEVVDVPHETTDIAGALKDLPGDLALILTGSATSDLHDTAPEGVRAAGGVVERFGMPVDPGNLLFIGTQGDRPVIGLPGCARSPALNGADWVLERIACGLDVSGADIAAMGVGGLLKEIPIRPHPRES